MGGGGGMIDSPLVSVRRGRKNKLGAGAFVPLFFLLLALGGVAGWDVVAGTGGKSTWPMRRRCLRRRPSGDGSDGSLR